MLRWSSSAALVGLLLVGSAPSADASLPLGDGKISTQGPRQGWIYSCVRPSGGVGAFRDGPWIKADGSWQPSEKLAVSGSVLWPGHSFKLSLAGAKLRLKGNGLPNHASGIFPIATSDPAYAYDRNPNTIKAQSIDYRLPARPKRAKKPSCLPMGVIAVGLSGVEIFNGLDGEGRDAVAHEIQDRCQGHPERSGAYHYHSLSSCIGDNNGGHSKIAAYALDGFAIYGPRGSDGKVLSNNELDICHGHSHVVAWHGHRRKLYHYHATDEYPYTLACYRGSPIKIKQNGPPPGPPPGPPLWRLLGLTLGR